MRLSNRLTISIYTILATVGFFFCYQLNTINNSQIVSYHGLFHGASIYQIYNGIFPPTHPLIVNSTPVSYWVWYLFLAATMKVTGVHFLLIGAAVNSFSFVACIALTYQISRSMKITRSISWANATLCLCFFAPAKTLIAYGLKLFFLEEIRTSRLVTLDKFDNQTTFPLALMLFLLFIATANSKDERNRSLRLAIAGMLPFAWLAINPIFLLNANLFVAAMIITDIWPNRRKSDWPNLTGIPAEYLRQFWPLILSNCICAICFLYIYAGELKPTIELSTSSVLTQATSPHLLSSFILTLLLIIFSMVAHSKSKLHYQMVVYLVVALTTCSTLEFSTRHQDHILLPFSILFCTLLFSLMNTYIANKKHLPTVILILSAALSLLCYRRWYIDALSNNRHNHFALSSQSLILHSTDQTLKSLNQACLWIKANTPRHSYIINRKENPNYLIVPNVAQRRVFLARWRNDRLKKTANFKQINNLHQQSMNHVKKNKHFTLSKRSALFRNLKRIDLINIDHLYLLIHVSKLSYQIPDSLSLQYSNSHYALFKLVGKN